MYEMELPSIVARLHSTTSRKQLLGDRSIERTLSKTQVLHENNLVEPCEPTFGTTE